MESGAVIKRIVTVVLGVVMVSLSPLRPLPDLITEPVALIIFHVYEPLAFGKDVALTMLESRINGVHAVVLPVISVALASGWTTIVLTAVSLQPMEFETIRFKEYVESWTPLLRSRMLGCLPV